MTEDVNVEPAEIVGEEGNDLTPEQALATEGGWKPEEEYTGDEGKWIDARTFNMRGELMDRIKSQTSQLRGQDRKINKLEEGLKNLSEHNNKMDEIAFKKALTELKTLKSDAMDVADHVQVVEIDDQIADLKASQQEADRVQDPAEEVGVNPEVAAWIDRNEWYKTDTTLRGAADALTMEVVRTRPELKGHPTEVLDLVSKRLKEEFPGKFGKVRRATTQSVAEPGQADTSSRSKGSSKKYTSKHLNEDQLAIGKTFVEAGAMKNLNEYTSQLAEMGELDVQKGA